MGPAAVAAGAGRSWEVESSSFAAAAPSVAGAAASGASCAGG